MMTTLTFNELMNYMYSSYDEMNVSIFNRFPENDVYQN